MSQSAYNIGLFGFGCVGKGLFDVLQKSPGFKTEIRRICVKNTQKERPISSSYFTFDRYEILDDPEIQVVVELIDDSEAAWEIVSYALEQGKSVVSANKKMIAEHFEELLELQKKYQVSFLYEASCCASIPILRNLEEYYDNDLLQSLTGIVNGSTNYILTQCIENGKPYELALQNAQELGYAETDPTLDVEGFDAKYKLFILLAHAFGHIVNPVDIFREGITRIGAQEIRFAREKGYKIKLLAKAFKGTGNQVHAFVMPAFVENSNHLFGVDDVFNGIITETAFSDKQVFIGKGAGAFPTASAVLSDLSALSYQYRYEFKKMKQEPLEFCNRCIVPVYIRWDGNRLDNVQSYFTSVQEIHLETECSYLIGEISIDALQHLVTQLGVSYSILHLN